MAVRPRRRIRHRRRPSCRRRLRRPLTDTAPSGDACTWSQEVPCLRAAHRTGRVAASADFAGFARRVRQLGEAPHRNCVSPRLIFLVSITGMAPAVIAQTWRNTRHFAGRIVVAEAQETALSYMERFPAWESQSPSDDGERLPWAALLALALAGFVNIMTETMPAGFSPLWCGEWSPATPVSWCPGTWRNSRSGTSWRRSCARTRRSWRPPSPQSTTGAASCPSCPASWRRPSMTSGSPGTPCTRSLCGGPRQRGNVERHGRWRPRSESVTRSAPGTESPSYSVWDADFVRAKCSGADGPRRTFSLVLATRLGSAVAVDTWNTYTWKPALAGGSACRPKLPRFSPGLIGADSPACGCLDPNADCKVSKSDSLGKC
ncbi:hypothetical protein BJY27_009618 [Streptomyces rapamycinicus]|uniref:3-deoxy-manno-octulosonate cytidylyltransferase n=2 Tax=Streptomyces rapamycinicus TaxID=1226757 RepID=A0A3L8R0L2_STRRN|nr:hypothetical protein [Streptomyces rapamycinicus]RLV72903.1 3-deoxy-manno-octulosonate cytidylyltransferase [Streptomyces rapamycinicus NRRL 5491]